MKFRNRRVERCRLTDARIRCVIEATIGNLRPFRRGYARTKEGPFFDLRTIDVLIRAGALVPVRRCGNLRRLTAFAQDHGSLQ